MGNSKIACAIFIPLFVRLSLMWGRESCVWLFFALSVRNVREDVAEVSGWCIIAPQSLRLLQELSLKMEH